MSQCVSVQHANKYWQPIFVVTTPIGIGVAERKYYVLIWGILISLVIGCDSGLSVPDLDNMGKQSSHQAATHFLHNWIHVLCNCCGHSLTVQLWVIAFHPVRISLSFITLDTPNLVVCSRYNHIRLFTVPYYVMVPGLETGMQVQAHRLHSNDYSYSYYCTHSVQGVLSL